MRITIDNLDGAGPRDYTQVLSAEGPLTIERVLNAPSRCLGSLLAGGAFMPGADPGLPTPVRRARVVVTTQSGGLLFTGYIAAEPDLVYTGVGIAGPVYRTAFTALSDEWLLDKQAAVLTGSGFAVDPGTLLGALAERTAAGVLTAPSAPSPHPVGVFTPQPTAPFSGNAAALAASSYAAYRAVNGALTLQPVGGVTHTVDLDSPGPGEAVQPGSLRTASARELANDVTLTGELEPNAYVTELFSGDGVTASFVLASQPFHASTATPLSDTFEQATLDPARWLVTDPGAHIGTGAGGLVLTGGNGFDGQTTLAARDEIELGGTLVFEAENVQLAAPSDGVLTGLYSGAVQRPDCIAGWNVRQSGGNTVLTPLLNGIETGASYIIAPAHIYTLRIRLHVVEIQRVRQTYYARIDGVVERFGGGVIDCGASAVFELIDLGDTSNTPATVLYDGNLTATPAACTFAAVNSIALTGSVGAISVRPSGSAWVAGTLSGATHTRLAGVAGTGADFQLSSTGVLTFFSGRIPAPGEILTVSYRTGDRAVARLNDPASVAAEAAGGAPGTARWLGRVIRPHARSTEDCEAAAQAVLALATSRAAAQSGSYTAVNPPQDIWPGDVLDLTSSAQSLNVVVRTVTLTDAHAAPECITCRATYANDWAEALGITLSETVTADATLPGTALPAPAATLASLSALTVVSTTATALNVDAGVDPPPGGGFEVRRADFGFGPTPGAELVVRSSVRAFTIPRASFRESFYIRMYDGSTPPVYSRRSAAVITNLPVA